MDTNGPEAINTKIKPNKRKLLEKFKVLFILNNY